MKIFQQQPASRIEKQHLIEKQLYIIVIAIVKIPRHSSMYRFRKVIALDAFECFLSDVH